MKPGDRVAHLGKNTDLYLELLLGAAKAGAVMTPVNWRLAPREFAYIINDSEAKVLFVGPEFIAAVEGLAEPLRVSEIVGMEAPFKGRAFVEWRDAQPTRDPQILIKRDSAGVQLYTSGTTGNPKGAVLSHRNHRRHAASVQDVSRGAAGARTTSACSRCRASTSAAPAGRSSA